ncbi:MAG: division/cell wall cluster transcriptional repressor MraZ [Planctomycetia bacterium]|nr:division/cell wall cluster transcriptional repressor MraZ [Planctomycetia bacterium]
MATTEQFILGEEHRTLDERCRLSIPVGMLQLLSGGETKDCILAKERPGCLSLWAANIWEEKLQEGVELIQKKMQMGRLEGRLEQVQMLGRLLSTRHTSVSLAGRGRLVLPEGFRDFLGVEPGGEIVIVGAAVCVELWNPKHWYNYLNEQISAYRQLFEELSQ